VPVLNASPDYEEQRLKALYDFNILDSLYESEYDDIAKIASIICETPISFISLMDRDRQWYKAKLGLEVAQNKREIAICAHAMDDPHQLFEVEDLRKDVRFEKNPLVIGQPNVVFYAGVPLTTIDGFPVGTICVLDQKPRKLNSAQEAALKSLSNQVIKLMELRKINALLEQNKSEIELKNEALEKLAYIISHDIRSPLQSLTSLTEMLEETIADNNQALEITKLISNNLAGLTKFANSLLDYNSTKNKELLWEELQIEQVWQNIDMLVMQTNDVTIYKQSTCDSIVVPEFALNQILLNLITNGIKYNDKTIVIISVSITKSKRDFILEVTDNGSGIILKDVDRIFKPFITLGKKDRFNKVGTGVGLATVAHLVDRMGGNITVNSNKEIGTAFIIKWPIVGDK